MGACAALSVVAMPVHGMPVAIVTGALTLAWGLAHLRLAHSTAHPATLLTADLVVMTAVALSQPLTVPESQPMHGNTWVLVTISIVAVTYQLTHRPVVGVAVAVHLAAADLVGVVLDRPDDWTAALPNVGWLLVEAGLARTLAELVRRRSRVADRSAAHAAAARRQIRLEEVRAAAEREHLATLHDTACATLLMASVRGESVSPELLREQAGRDLERLASARSPRADTDLAEALVQESAAHPLHVDPRVPAELGPVPPAVTLALRDAVGEVLRNVVLHARVDAARVTAQRSEGRVTVTVTDEGEGFSWSGVPAHRQGLALSVLGRMTAVGGRASVDSRPGTGTSVTLEWPSG